VLARALPPQTLVHLADKLNEEAKDRGLKIGVAPPRATSVGLSPPERRLRSSRGSRDGLCPARRRRHGGAVRAREARRGGADCEESGQEWNHIVALLSRAVGLR